MSAITRNNLQVLELVGMLDCAGKGCSVLSPTQTDDALHNAILGGPLVALVSDSIIPLHQCCA
eukprot:2516601-Amphidinium_carterae.2